MIVDIDTGEILGTTALQTAEPIPMDPSRLELRKTGLVLPSELTLSEWESIGTFLAHAEGAIHWWIGDWLNYGEQRYGEMYVQALDATGFAYQTLANDKRAASRVEFSRRRENLSFGHHCEIAHLEPDNQDVWLDRASAGDDGAPWSLSRLRMELRRGEHAAKIASLTPTVIEPDENIVNGSCLEFARFEAEIDLIVADPPYGLSVDGQAGVREGKGEWDELAYPELHAFNQEWLRIAVRALKPGGSLLVFGSLHNIFSVGHILRDIGCYLVRDIVWSKPFVQRAVNLNALVPAHEIIIWARKADHHTCNLFEITRDIWEVQPAAPFGHPAEKPEPLIERLITMASNPGDFVADPFLGSGVTTAVATRLKRSYFGTEIDETWCKIARERTRKASLLRI